MNNNTMNTKTYAIVANNGISVLMNQAGQYKNYKGETNLVASLKALQSILNQVPTNDTLADNITKVIIGQKSPIKGFTCGSHLTYIRTGKNMSGKEFTPEELTLIKTVSTMLANRSLNIWLVTDEFVGKQSADYKLFNNAWTVQKQLAKQAASTVNNAKITLNDVNAMLNAARERMPKKQDAVELMNQLAELQKQLALLQAKDEMSLPEEMLDNGEMAVEDPDDLLE